MSVDTPAVQSRFERDRHGFCVAMFDIDQFKRYNDNSGHQAGDRLLEEVGAAIASDGRPCDLAYRYGGDEFLILHPVQTVATTSIAVHRVGKRVEKFASRTDLDPAAQLISQISDGNRRGDA